MSGETRTTATDRLRHIEAVLDARLADLDIDDLLVELLDRVRDTLAADTAAILLLDEPNGQLVARAARGLEGEVYQASHVPLGRGFAGRIAASRLPATIDDIGHAEVVNPVLRTSGIRSLLGVPLLTGGDLIGVLHVGTVARRRFDDEDVDLLQMVADRVAMAIRLSMAEAERNASLVLQRSFVPQRLPEVPGLDVAVRYSAGAGGTVGGDWYDLFVLPSGEVCITIGDVVGKGLPAAAVMGRLRSTLRALFFANGGDPEGALDLVDRHFKHFEPGGMATTISAVTEPPFDRVYLAVAGHPAPVMATVDGAGRYLDVAVGPPLGTPGTWRRRLTTIDLPPGAVLCFYTDGLIERRGEPITEGVDRLCRAVTATAPDDVCAEVMARMIGTDRPADDVALMVVRRNAGPAPG